MKTKLLKVFILLMLVSPFKSKSAEIDFTDAANTAAIDDLFEKCQAMSAIWSNLTPVVSTPPVIGFELNKTPMADLCIMVTQTRNYTMKLRDLQSKMTHFSQNKDAINQKLLTASVLYLTSFSSMDKKVSESTTQTVGSRERRSHAAFYKKLTGVSLTSATLDSAQNEKLKENRELTSRIEKLSGRRAALEDKIICKNGRNEKAKKSLVGKLTPIQDEFDQLVDQTDFIFNELMSLAGKFSRERSGTTYRSELLDLNSNAIQLDATNVYIDVDSYEKRPKPDAKGDFTFVPTKVKALTQKFKVLEKKDAFSKFTSKWSATWKENIKDNFDTLIDFLDAGSQCSDASIGVANYSNLDKAVESSQRLNYYQRACANSNIHSEKQAAVIFDENIKKYADSLRAQKSKEAEMLSLESLILEEPVVSNPKDFKDTLSLQKPICKEVLTEADMKELRIEIQKIDDEMSQLYAEGLMKKSQILEAQAEREKQIDDDRKIRQQIADEARQRNQRYNDMIPKSTESF